MAGASTSYSYDFESVSLATQLPGVYYARVFGKGGDANASYVLREDPAALDLARTVVRRRLGVTAPIPVSSGADT